jgi:hypothetical protein
MHAPHPMHFDASTPIRDCPSSMIAMFAPSHPHARIHLLHPTHFSFV